MRRRPLGGTWGVLALAGFPAGCRAHNLSLDLRVYGVEGGRALYVHHGSSPSFCFQKDQLDAIAQFTTTGGGKQIQGAMQLHSCQQRAGLEDRALTVLASCPPRQFHLVALLRPLIPPCAAPELLRLLSSFCWGGVPSSSGRLLASLRLARSADLLAPGAGVLASP